MSRTASDGSMESFFGSKMHRFHEIEFCLTIGDFASDDDVGAAGAGHTCTFSSYCYTGSVPFSIDIKQVLSLSLLISSQFYPFLF